MEVSRVKLGVPDRLVNPPELPDREHRRAERSSQRRVLQFGPGPLQAVGKDHVVIERQPVPGGADRHPVGGCRVAACPRGGQVRREGQIGDGYDVHP